MHHGHFFEMPAFDLIFSCYWPESSTIKQSVTYHMQFIQETGNAYSFAPYVLSYLNLIAHSDFRWEFEVKAFLTIGHMYAYVS